MVTDIPDERISAAKHGAIAGVVAGGVLTAMMTLMSLMRGTDVWFGIKGAAAPLLGAMATRPGFDLVPVWLGFIIHLAISVAWAIPFALLTTELGRGKLLLASLGWGIVVWLGMFYVLLPMFGQQAMISGAPLSRAIGYHLFFGSMVGAALLAIRRIEARDVMRRPSQIAYAH